MPKAKLQVNRASDPKSAGKPLLDVELDVTAQEIAQAHHIGVQLLASAKSSTVVSKLARLLRIKVNVVSEG